MRGQLSLEFLIIVLTATMMLSVMLPQIQKTREISSYALSSRNAQLILDKLYYSCERIRISGETEEIVVNALANFSVKNYSGSLIIVFGEKNLSKSPFNCYLDANLSQGTNKIILAPDL